MKKILFIAISIFILTGCTKEFTYEFKDNIISSTVMINFSDSEYKTYQEKYAGEYNESVYISTGMEKLITDTYNSSSGIAYIDDNGKYYYYNPLSYNRNNTNNTFSYKYDFSYEAFQNNYYLNNCFEFFTHTEDDNYYYYQISGAYTCENESNISFKIKDNNRLVETNSDEKKDNIYSWNIKKNENDIYFIISKNEINKNGGISKITIISFITILLLALSSTILYKKVQNNY